MRTTGALTFAAMAGTGGLLVVLLSGCAGVPKGRPDRVGFEDKLAQAIIKKYEAEGAIPTDEAVTKEKRNEILDDLVYLTDVNYYSFTSKLYMGRAYFAVGSDLAAIGLGAAGTLVPAAATKAILAAIAGGIAGGRVSIDKHFFQEQSTIALIAKMNASRERQLALLREAMANLDARDYKLSRGLGDVRKYYEAGTVLGALQDIVESSGVEKAKAADELKATIRATYGVDANSAILRIFWKPEGKVSAVNAQRLDDWIAEEKLNVSIPTFIKAAEYAEQRSKAVKDLKLRQSEE